MTISLLGLEILFRLSHMDILSCEALASELKTTKVKVRDEIKQINRMLDNVAMIHSKRGKGNGYYLSIEDNEAFIEFMKSNETEYDSHIKNVHELLDRTEKITMYLLELNGYIKLEQLAERFYISSRQMSSDLRVVRNILKNYDILVKDKPYHGLYVDGSEFSKRVCTANIIMKNLYRFSGNSTISTHAEIDEQMCDIKKMIIEEASKLEISFSDIALENLTIHIFVTKERASRGYNVIPYKKEKAISDSVLSNNILKRLEEMYNIQFSDYDRQYLDIHVAGKRMYSLEDNLISPEVNNLTIEILKGIDFRFFTNYQNDEQLIIRFSLHLIPLLIRIENHFVSVNPLAEDIKGTYKISNEMACVAADIINRKYHVQLPQDEISYIALHLELSSYMAKVKKYNILLVCNNGKMSSEILRQQLQMRFSHYISNIDVTSINHINQVDLEEYMFILSTIPLRAYTSTPIYQIDNFLTPDSMTKIETIMRYGDFNKQDISIYFPEELFMIDVKAEDKEDVISQMVSCIEKHRDIQKGFLESVLKREQLSSTDYGNRVAIPHPFQKMSNSFFTCVAVLNHEISWGINEVRVVMLTSISTDTQNLQSYYYMLTKMIADEDKMDRFIKNPSYQNFLSIIKEK